MNNRDKVKEDIARFLRELCTGEDNDFGDITPWSRCNQFTKDLWLTKADNLLAIDNLEVKADDQNLPHMALDQVIYMGANNRELRAYIKNALDKAGWVKVEKEAG
jgi:hypothetical protein